MPNDRSYDISGRWNWDVLAKIDIARLHDEKRKAFWFVYESFKEVHYRKYWLKDKIFQHLKKPIKTEDLSNLFDRSFARTSEILSQLKEEGKIRNFRVESHDYWTRNKRIVVISKIKKKYLESLSLSKKTVYRLAKELKVGQKSVKRRLQELQRLGLVYQDRLGLWTTRKIKKKIVTL